ncbi:MULTISPECIES: stalk domain-containing protein [Paenibacillus]|uniref:stalk domain-containing protein n=1 Tax=Paenibacillus TaxID=44249 RepID=UPI0022B91BE4|nr:stalk domain-containing protein [Paenibacillus caseinilyticus]MCZ8520907.1 stalk domain-containing protein [Paenibacillus caseinilyticus]
MNKFMMGIACGAALTATTAVYASTTIQAYLFPAAFVINGEDKAATSYETLNYNGSAYVPVRFVSESLGAAVAYDETSKTITIDSGLDIVDVNNRYTKAGHLTVAQAGSGSTISGKLYIGQDAWDHKFLDAIQSMNPDTDNSSTTVSGTLVFWNDKGEVMEKVPYKVDGAALQKEQIVSLQAASQTDVSGYAVVTLEKTQPSPRPFYDPAGPLIQDPTGMVAFGVLNMERSGDYTVMRALLNTVNFAGTIPAQTVRISFLDESGNTLDTIHTTFDQKTDPMYTVLVGKGDLTRYKSVKVELMD